MFVLSVPSHDSKKVWLSDHTVLKTVQISLQGALPFGRLCSTPVKQTVRPMLTACFRFGLWGDDEESCRRKRKPEISIVSVFVSGDEHCARNRRGLLSLPAISFADEDGVSFWLPGIYGQSCGSPAGARLVSLRQSTIMTVVSASGCVAGAREITIGKLNPTVNVNPNIGINERIFLDRRCRDQCLLSHIPENFRQTTCINQARLCAAP